MEMHRTMTADTADRADREMEPCMDPPPAIGKDERRMHVRAYNFWAALLRGRTFPAIADLNPETIGDFGPHGVLLDFTGGSRDPAILWLGSALRDEGGHSGDVRTLADVPGRSLLSRLTDHFADVVANRAPIGFEAEFDNVRGNHALYRGILMPFSSDGDTVDYIYGVINWKEVASARMVAGIAAEVARAAPAAPRPAVATPVWADGPSRASSGVVATVTVDEGAERLAAARDGVDLARSTSARARIALYRALGLTYDALLAATPAEIRDGWSGPQRLAQSRALVRDVFGADEERHHRATYALILAYGLRTGVAMGGLRMLLEREEDGLRSIAAAERAAGREALAA